MILSKRLAKTSSRNYVHFSTIYTSMCHRPSTAAQGSRGQSDVNANKMRMSKMRSRNFSLPKKYWPSSTDTWPLAGTWTMTVVSMVRSFVGIWRRAEVGESARPRTTVVQISTKGVKDDSHLVIQHGLVLLTSSTIDLRSDLEAGRDHVNSRHTSNLD